VLFELTRLGERAAQRGVATAHLDEVSSDSLAEEYRVVGDARQRWLAVLAAKQVANLFDAEKALRDRAVQIVQERRRLGEANELEVAASRLEAAEVGREARRAEGELATARCELNRVLGLPPDYELILSDIDKPLHVVLFNDPADDDLDQRLLSGRYELKAKQSAYQKSERELRLAILRQYPKVKIGPSFGTEPEGTNYLGVGASIELPIFDRNQGGIAEAEAVRKTARAEYISLLHKLRADAFDARDQLRRARAEVDEQERTVLPLIRQNEQLFEAAYRARELSIVEWGIAQQRNLKSRRDYLDTLIRYRQKLIELETALGSPLSGPATQPATTQSLSTNNSTGRSS